MTTTRKKELRHTFAACATFRTRAGRTIRDVMMSKPRKELGKFPVVVSLSFGVAIVLTSQALFVNFATTIYKDRVWPDCAAIAAAGAGLLLVTFLAAISWRRLTLTGRLLSVALVLMNWGVIVHSGGRRLLALVGW